MALKFTSKMEECPGCETGCSPGHVYLEDVCCFKQPGLTWSEFYIGEEDDFLAKETLRVEVMPYKRKIQDHDEPIKKRMKFRHCQREHGVPIQMPGAPLPPWMMSETTMHAGVHVFKDSMGECEDCGKDIPNCFALCGECR